ncbi:MAG: hypothetical protein WCK17_03255 [Verrucomicrobiota bacterium]
MGFVLVRQRGSHMQCCH